MSKMNPKGKAKVVQPKVDLVTKWYSRDRSKEGMKQFVKAPEQVLYEICVGNMLGKDTFYQAADDVINNLIDAITLCVRKGNIDFVAKLCVYARHEMHMRSMPMVAAVHFMYVLRQEKVAFTDMRKWARALVGRADELLDVYQYALTVFGDKRKIPQAFKKGLGDAMNKFDAYQFGKYDRNTGLKFRDLLRIVHPTPKDDKQSALFEKIMKQELEAPKTHEAMRTAAAKGHEGALESADAVWKNLMKDKKLGYMAAVRNIATIIREGDDETFNMLCDLLGNQHAMRGSKIFPYQVYLPMAMMRAQAGTTVQSFRHGGDQVVASMLRYFTQEVFGDAHRMQSLNNTLNTFASLAPARKNRLLSSLNTALDYASTTLPDLGNNVVIYLDTSGSMKNTFLRMMPMVAALVRMMKGKNFALIGFDSNARVLDVHPDSSARDIMNYLMDKFNGGATVLQSALSISTQARLGFKPEVAILISDMQISQCVGYGGFGQRSMKDVNSITVENPVLRDCRLRVAFNVDSNVSTCAPEGEWYNVSGYSSNMFDVFDLASKGATFEDIINQYTY